MLRVLIAMLMIAVMLDGQAIAQDRRGGFGRGQGFGPGPGDGPQLPRQANEAFERGNFVQAERLYRRLLEEREQGRYERFPMAAILIRLGYSIGEQARYTEAEPILRRALSVSEKDGETSMTAGALTSLGSVVRWQGRSAEAEPLMRRAAAIRERLEPDSPMMAITLGHLARVLRDLGKLDEAEAAVRRSLQIREAKLGPDSSFVGMSLNALAMTLRAQGKLEEAVRYAERAVAVQQKHDPLNPRLALSLHGLGQVKLSAGDAPGATAAFQRAVEIREKSLGPLHPETAQAFANLAMALALQDRLDAGLVAIRRATEIERARRAGDDKRYDEGAETERRSASWQFARHAALAHQASIRARPADRDELMSEAFEMAQWARTGAAAGAVVHMSARFASGTGPLAELVRQRQDALARRRILDRELLEMLSKPQQERDAAAETAARNEINDLGRELTSLDKAISKDFPAFAELSTARPVKLSQAKQLLGADEALLLYLVRDNDAFLWLLRGDKTTWVRLRATPEALQESIKALRGRLNPAENPNFEPMPIDQAHRLYRDLVAPVESALAGVRHLIVVPDGPLQSLPFGLLATAPPKGGGDSDYRAASWLLRKYAVTVLPSISSLQALRATAAAPIEREPFAGFGDPALAGRSTATPARGGSVIVMRGYVADASALQQLEPLPESGRELAELARSMRASPDRVWTRKDATETRVKTTDLSRFRVLAFATHGLMAGEFLDFAEPALVLTPPQAGTATDDGLLTASEVAQLKLDADWVILSACNTAAPDGTPGAEGLSGLAKAFFYAGARSLLVSNWYVASDAAVRLTTGAVAVLDREPGLGRAEALRRSMLAMLDDPKTPKQMTHPMFWAPFALVGEGGAGR